MVTRKPVAPRSGQATPTSPAYPLAASFAEQPTTRQADPSFLAAASDPEMDNAWSDEGTARLNPQNASRTDLPEALRVGPHDPPSRSSQESNRVLAPTNPYLRKHNTGSSTGESSANAWGDADRPPIPSHAPPPPPIPQDTIPSQQLTNLSISEPSTNPWQPALNEASISRPPQPPTLQPEDSGNDAWAIAPPARAAPTVPPLDTSQPALLDVEESESPAWDEDQPATPITHEMPADHVTEAHQIQQEAHAWDEDSGHTTAPPAFVAHVDAPPQGEGWNLIDYNPEPPGPQQTGIVRREEQDIETSASEGEAPALPPRRSAENPPAQPPRPTVETSESAAVKARKQKETYEIKKISWYDANAAENPRVSPILVQNANGPCPLLALVNALTLSTAAGVNTALVETLRSRERVSLGLLLDAVFDELMSGRRGDAAQGLPDVSDLYSFLITLHSGMNVNPRFLPLPRTDAQNDPRRSMSHVHPSDRQSNLPGSFEETREMKLYSTFSIPLIHGWLPEENSPAIAALTRSAKTYEDAQNLMFHEEELEEKLQREGLSFEEQGMLEDIATIKAFFASNATQLTGHGLSCITNFLAPGAVAILFRNDHFSTLYRQPQTLQLLQLVTDMGYAGHDEVVWESLSDISGESAEFFSGDFRLVGGASQTPATDSTPSNEEWTTVTGRHQRNQNGLSANDAPVSPAVEQEDHDLALALQLQEEEEERHRSETARRRRETELSQQFIEQQASSSPNTPIAGRQTAANIPVSQRGGSSGRRFSRGGRRSSANPVPVSPIPPRTHNPSVPLNAAAHPPVTSRPVDPEAGVDVPPPSYEMAASQEAYVPSDHHPAHPNAAPGGRQGEFGNGGGGGGAGAGRGMGRRPTVEYAGGMPPRRNQGPPGMAQGQGMAQAGNVEKERDCVVM